MGAKSLRCWEIGSLLEWHSWASPPFVRWTWELAEEIMVSLLGLLCRFCSQLLCRGGPDGIIGPMVMYRRLLPLFCPPARSRARTIEPGPLTPRARPRGTACVEGRANGGVLLAIVPDDGTWARCNEFVTCYGGPAWGWNSPPPQKAKPIPPVE